MWITYSDAPNTPVKIGPVWQDPPTVEHIFTEWIVIKEATCTANGVALRYCTECRYTESETIIASHTEVILKAVAPTCTETGLTEGKHCSKCSEVLIEQEIVPANGHQYENGVCLACGDVYIIDYTQYFNFTLLNDGSYEISGVKGNYPAELVIPSTYLEKAVTSIGASAFSNCTNLRSIKIPESITDIGKGALHGSIQHLYINNVKAWLGIKSVDASNGHPMYYGELHILDNDGNEISELVIPDGVTYIGIYKFYNCKNLKTVTIPNSVQGISIGAFENCTNLMSVYMPNSMTEIGWSSFAGCSSLTSITIPDGVTSIGSCAFNNCSSLTSVVIGKDVSNITYSAFGSCKNLTTVYYAGTPSDWNHIRFEENNNAVKDATRYYYSEIHPADAIYTYWHYVDGVPTVWHIPTVVIDEAVAATCTATGLTEGKHCSVCNEVLVAQTTVPSLGHTEVIDEAVAPTCTETGLTEGKHCSVCGETLVVQEVAPAAEHRSNIPVVVIPPTATDDGIATDTCPVCGDTYTKAIVPTDFKVTSSNRSMIGYTGAEGENLVIPAAFEVNGTWYRVTSIAGQAFYGCNNLASITIPNSVTSIGGQAFLYCKNLSSITIPYSVTKIGAGAFIGCDSLTNIMLSDENTSYEVKGNCLIEKSSKTLIFGCKNGVIPTDGSVTKIGAGAFGALTITSITIPDTVTSIGTMAFYFCRSLTSITFEGTVEQWIAISLENEWNGNVPATEVVCSDGIVTLT